MYKELVKRLRERSVFLFPHHGESRSYDADLMHEAADAIEELSVECKEWKERGNALEKTLNVAFSDFAKIVKNQSWIPMTETPPLKVGDDCYNGYLVYANGYYEVADYTTDKIDNVPYFHVNGEYDPDVTHWQPLPEPPKEET